MEDEEAWLKDAFARESLTTFQTTDASFQFIKPAP